MSLSMSEILKPFTNFAVVYYPCLKTRDFRPDFTLRSFFKQYTKRVDSWCGYTEAFKIAHARSTYLRFTRGYSRILYGGGSELISANGKSDSGRLFTSLEFCLPFAQTVCLCKWQTTTAPFMFHEGGFDLPSVIWIFSTK